MRDLLDAETRCIVVAELGGATVEAVGKYIGGNSYRVSDPRFRSADIMLVLRKAAVAGMRDTADRPRSVRLDVAGDDTIITMW